MFRTTPDVDSFQVARVDMLTQCRLADAKPLSRCCGGQKDRASNPG
jgi:hypothetical protein